MCSTSEFSALTVPSRVRRVEVQDYTDRRYCSVLNPAATQLTPDVSRQTQAPAFDGAQKSNQDPFTQGINPTTTIRPAMQTMRPNAAGHAAVPAAAVLGLFGGAVALANL